MAASPALGEEQLVVQAETRRVLLALPLGLRGAYRWSQELCKSQGRNRALTHAVPAVCDMVHLLLTWTLLGEREHSHLQSSREISSTY